MKNKVRSTWNEKMSFDIETPGGKITIDVPEELGGDDNGLRPKALMLDALAGCTALDVSSLIKKMRLEVEDIQIDVEASLTDEHPKTYSDVNVEYRFYGLELDKEKLTKVVNMSAEKYCGVMEMFRAFSNITIEINFFDQ